MKRLSVLVVIASCGSSRSPERSHVPVAPKATAQPVAPAEDAGEDAEAPADDDRDEQAEAPEPPERPDPPAIPAIPVRDPTRGKLSPSLDLGEVPFVHGSTVRHVAACDATRALSLDDGPRLLAWNLPDGARRGVIGDLDSGYSRDIACRGELALRWRGDTVELWRADKRIASVAPKRPVAAIALDGERAIVLDIDGTVHELDERGTLKRLWKGEPPTLHTTLRADRYVFFGSAKLSWSTPTGTKAVTFPADLAAIGDLGDGIALADVNGAVRVLTAPAVVAPSFSFDPELGAAWSIAGDRAWIAVGTHDGALVQWKRGSRAPVAPLQVIEPQMYASIHAIAIAGDAWLVGGDDRRIHRIPRGATTHTRPPHAGPDDEVDAIATDGTWIVSGSDDTIQIHTLAGALVRQLRPKSEFSEVQSIHAVGITPKLVWALGGEGTLFRWRRPGFEPLKRISNIYTAAALDDATLAVTVVSTVGTLDLATGKITTFAKDLNLLTGEISARKDLIVVIDTARNPQPVFILDRSGALRAQLDAVHENSTTTVAAIAKDAQTVAIAENGEVRLWSRATNKLSDLGAHPTLVSAMAFADDGTLAAGDWYGRTRIWKPGESAPRYEIDGHLGWVLGIAWSGRKLVTAARDGHLQLVDVPR